MDQKKVPVLITWDVDPDRWTTLEKREEALSKALDLCDEFGINSTFFFTANYAHEYPEYIKRMQETGHEIGCHGLTHGDEEDFDRMSEELQIHHIQEATQKLAAVTNAPVLTFRSPRVKTSAVTLKILAESGYLADSSVCSQRLDFVSSNLINPGWLVAPRLPYFPHHANAYKKGDIPIWEIPISALIFPFISGSINVFGLSFMKALSWLLIQESKLTGKPIVYLAHPTEFTFRKKKNIPIKLSQLSPNYIRTHGFLLRRNLYRMTNQAWHSATRELFAYIASFHGVYFVTCSEYARLLGI